MAEKWRSAPAVPKWAQAPEASPTPPQGPTAGSVASQGMSGVNEGIANTLGAPVDLANSLIGLGMAGVNKVAGTDFKPAEEPVAGSAQFKRMMGDVGGTGPRSDIPIEQMARRTGQSVGAAVMPAMGSAAYSATPVATLLGTLGSGASGGASAAVANQVAPGNQIADFVADLAGGMAPSLVSGMVGKVRADRAQRDAVPSVDDLKANAGALYDQAEASGVTANQAQTQALSDRVHQIAANEGLISPTGRVNSAYPKISESLQMFDDYAKGDMSVVQMKAVRRVLQDAAGSAEPAERRLGSMILKEFDNFTAPLAPPLTEARGLYTRAMKGDQIDTAIELAGSKAGQYTGSGFENALRTEFRNIERRIIKGQERGFSPNEVAAISRVAQGGPVQNALRTLGKLAPTSAVSFGAGVGIPYAIGNSVAGPVGGMAAATGTALMGYGARNLATGMGQNAAEEASLLMRNGGPFADIPLLPAKQREIAAALLAAQLGNQASRTSGQ